MALRAEGKTLARDSANSNAVVSVRRPSTNEGPDFLCIGLQKAGTRWLYDQLAYADGVWMPPIKELNYFEGRTFKPSNLQVRASASRWWFPFGRHSLRNRRFFRRFEAGMAPEGYTDHWYISLFSPKAGCLSGDISPAYATLGEESVSRVAALLPHAKVILLLRHPVERAKSALSMKIRTGALTEEELSSPDQLRKIISRRRFRTHSRPSIVWPRWLDRFGAERCRYFFLDDIRERPEHVREQIAEFLELERPRFRLQPDFNVKHTEKRYAVPPESEAFLYRYYEEEVRRCRELFGARALDWRTEL